MTLLWYTKTTLTQYKSDTDPAQKRYWPSTKTILTRYKSDTDPVQKRYRLIPFLVLLYNVSVPEPVTSPVLVYGTGTCNGTVRKTCIEIYHIGTLYRIQRYRNGTTYHRWTVLERVPIDNGMFTGWGLLSVQSFTNFPPLYFITFRIELNRRSMIIYFSDKRPSEDWHDDVRENDSH